MAILLIFLLHTSQKKKFYFHASIFKFDVKCIKYPEVMGKRLLKSFNKTSDYGSRQKIKHWVEVPNKSSWEREKNKDFWG